MEAKAFVSSDTNASSQHYNLKMERTTFTNLSRISAFLYANKSVIADSIVIRNCAFENLQNGFLLSDEKDNKGYYNAEKITIVNNVFTKGNGYLLNVYRGGNDESTLGPDLNFSGNTIENYSNATGAVILFTGVQKTWVAKNVFRNCNYGSVFLKYLDFVRARHLLENNIFSSSGEVEKNAFVQERNNKMD
jgi:poly(beta-D-mannuronate) lyase